MRCHWHRAVVVLGVWQYTAVCCSPVAEVWLRRPGSGAGRRQVAWCKDHGMTGAARWASQGRRTPVRFAAESVLRRAWRVKPV